jgi:putative ABC transport system permease protein
MAPALTGSGEAAQLRAARVTTNFFEVMGAGPAIGRGFGPEDERAAVAVLGHGLWMRRFGGDPAILGRTLLLDSVPHVVVGILPEYFQFPERGVDLWLPLQPGPNEREQRGPLWLRCVARLRPGVTLAEAQNEMDVVAARLAATHGEDRGLGVRLVGLHEEVTAPFRPALLLLGAASLGVLLIACGNVAAMLTARGAARRREVAVRIALGAGHRRLLRQLLTEALTLFLAGGAAGLIVAYTVVSIVARSRPASLPQLAEVALDWPMAAFSIVQSLVTGVVFGALPGRNAARTDVVAGLAGSAKGAGGQNLSLRFHRALVLVQAALATLVLAAAGLLVRSLVQLQQTDLGLERSTVLTAEVVLPKSRYRDGSARARLMDGLLERLRALPGVAVAGAGSSLLLGPLPESSDFTPEGALESVKDPITVDAVTPEFFRTLGVKLVRGRLFTDGDRGGDRVALINETAARRHWPGVDPVGRRLKLGGPEPENPWLTIVGVVADTRRAGAERPVFAECYQPHWQAPASSMVLVLRGDGDPALLAGPLRAAVRALDPDLPLSGVAVLDDLLEVRTAGRRFTAWLLTAFGMLAAVLTAVGLYGLLAYLVVLRRREIAVRMTLGAKAAEVLRLVLGQVLGAAAVGAGVGAVAAVGAARALRGLLFGTSPIDPAAHVAVAGLLVVVALVSAWVPARRALRVEPMVALRDE